MGTARPNPSGGGGVFFGSSVSSSTNRSQSSSVRLYLSRAFSAPVFLARPIPRQDSSTIPATQSGTGNGYVERVGQTRTAVTARPRTAFPCETPSRREGIGATRRHSTPRDARGTPRPSRGWATRELGRRGDYNLGRESSEPFRSHGRGRRTIPFSQVSRCYKSRRRLPAR